MLFQPSVGGYEPMVLLNKPWYFANGSLYQSLLVRAETLSI